MADTSVVMPPGLTGKMIMSPKISIPEQPSDIMCVRVSPNSQLVACGNQDSTITVFNIKTGKLTYTLNTDKEFGSMPITSIRWRPELEGAQSRNVLLAANADGSVVHWHVSSQKAMHMSQEEDNQVFAVDYDHDGLHFATAGRDKKVRIYSEATKQEMSCLTGGSGDEISGHANRVFSLKYKPNDINLLVSGGWDNTIQVWDVRTGASVRQIYGPHICGDSVDIWGDLILSGSWRAENALQLWDFGTGKLVSDIEYGATKTGKAALLYAAQFSRDGRFVAAGGTGSNDAKVFGTTAGVSIGRVDQFEAGVYSLDWAPNGTYVALGGADRTVVVQEMHDMGKLGKK